MTCPRGWSADRPLLSHSALNTNCDRSAKGEGGSTSPAGIGGAMRGPRCGGGSVNGCGSPARISTAVPVEGGAVNRTCAVTDCPGRSPVRLAATNGSPAAVKPLTAVSRTPFDKLVKTIRIGPLRGLLLTFVIVT